MNCAVDYKDEEIGSKSVSATKLLPTRRILKNLLKAPQECVGNNGLTKVRWATDRQVGVARIPQRAVQVATCQVREKQ